MNIYYYMNIKRIIREELNNNESDDLQWIKDVDSNPRNFNYYIIDSRSLAHNSSTFNFDDEWVLLKVIDREPNGDIIFQSVARNLDDGTSWSSNFRGDSMEGYWFDFLLGIGPSAIYDDNAPEGHEGEWKPPYWFPHDGDTSHLPKNRNYSEYNNINESDDDFDFIKNVKPTISKGTYLCDRYGTKWQNMSETEFNGFELVASDAGGLNDTFIWLVRTHDYGKKIVRRVPNPWKIEDVIRQLSDGSLTICDNPNTLKESGELDWIKNVDISSYRPRDGEYFEVINVGSNEDYRNWLGDYSYHYESGEYGETIKGMVREETSIRNLGFTLQEENTGDVIFFPFYHHMKTLNDEPDEPYRNLKLEYRPIKLNK